MRTSFDVVVVMVIAVYIQDNIGLPREKFCFENMNK